MKDCYVLVEVDNGVEYRHTYEHTDKGRNEVLKHMSDLHHYAQASEVGEHELHIHVNEIVDGVEKLLYEES